MNISEETVTLSREEYLRWKDIVEKSSITSEWVRDNIITIPRDEYTRLQLLEDQFCRIKAIIDTTPSEKCSMNRTSIPRELYVKLLESHTILLALELERVQDYPLWKAAMSTVERWKSSLLVE